MGMAGARTAVVLLLATPVYLVAGATHLPHCPHHGSSEQVAGSADHAIQHGSHAVTVAASETDHHPGHGANGDCRCDGKCCPPTAPAPQSDRSDTRGDEGTLSGETSAPASVQGPRHPRFTLPPATAPPG